MGSVSRENAIKLFSKVYGNKLEEYFTPLLVGKMCSGLSNIKADFYVKGELEVNKKRYPVHHRWSSEEEDSAGVELDEDYVLFQDYYDKHFHQKTITRVVVTIQDRDDEAYLTIFTNDQEEVNMQIPLGFDPERNEFSSFAEALLSEEEREAIEVIQSIKRNIYLWNRASTTIESDAQYIESITTDLFDYPEAIDPTNRISDFEKMSKLFELFNQERIDCLELLNQTRFILKQ